ncbi:MAG: glycoside hydrolase family 108 protein [Pseudolabrys sp.]
MFARHDIGWRGVLVAALFSVLVITVSTALSSNWPRSLANVLVSEGGNDDDPRDPGGRTSRGIIQREWDAWRRTRPGLPADVWQAPQREVEAIYRAKYWDHPCVRADDLPAGLDYTVFDYGVNSGVGRAGKVLRRVLRLSDAECAVTDDVLAALRKRGKFELIEAINAERMRFLRGLRTWRYFGNGWGRRVESVRVISLRMAGPATARPIELWPAYGPHKAYEGDTAEVPP